VVERIKKEYQAEIDWKPFLLHPEAPEKGPRMPPPSRNEHFKAMRERLKQLANSYGLPFVESGIRPDSRRALEASEYAQAHGKNEEFHRAVFKKLLGEGQDIHDWSVLRAAAQESGLDGDAMQREVESGKYLEILNEKLAEAQALDVNAVPTYIVNGTYLIEGAQPFEEFKRLFDYLAEQGSP